MNALASPYRFAETPLMTRERALEQELTSTRYMLDALANEEVRVARCVRLKQAPQSDLDGLRDTLWMHLANEERLSHELEAVRAEIVARGERKVVRPDADGDFERFAFLVTLATCIVGAVVFLLVQLADVNTARAAPSGTSFEWAGPLDAGMTWLYVEGPAGTAFEIDGRSYEAPNAVAVSALNAHDLRFRGGRSIHVRRIPCTTAVVRYDARTGEASVERFYNSSTCF